jgi:hypothetical protein
LARRRKDDRQSTGAGYLLVALIQLGEFKTGGEIGGIGYANR